MRPSSVGRQKHAPEGECQHKREDGNRGLHGGGDGGGGEVEAEHEEELVAQHTALTWRGAPTESARGQVAGWVRARGRRVDVTDSGVHSRVEEWEPYPVSPSMKKDPSNDEVTRGRFPLQHRMQHRSGCNAK